MQPGIGIGDSDDQLGCSVHSGFVVLPIDVVNSLSTVKSVHISNTSGPLTLWIGNFEKPLGRQNLLRFLVAPRTSVGHQDQALESSAHPIVSASGFLPVVLNFDTLVCLVPDELCGPLFDGLGLHEGSEGGHGAE